MSRWPTLPGETPLDDISGLKIKGIATRAQLNQAEAKNILRPTIKYLLARPSTRSARFDLAWCHRLHKEMFGQVWKWAGTIRRVELNIGIPHYQIETALQTLMDDLAYWRKTASLNILEQSVLLHHRAVLIHPYLNGNGRWARMLANIWCRQADGRIIRWPEEVIGAQSAIRADYLKAIKAADAGELGLLTEMHRKFLS